MVTIFRIGHRIFRDKRITTHLALVSRALGASGIVIAGEKDVNIIKSVQKVVTEWGGNFTIKFIPFDEWKPFLEERVDRQDKIIHLTMYGENFPIFRKRKDFIELRSSPDLLKRLLIVVGGEKVPAKVFQYANWNVAISNQPHSEVGSLSIFLNRLILDSLERSFSKPSRKINPSIAGKKSYSGIKDDDD